MPNIVMLSGDKLDWILSYDNADWSVNTIVVLHIVCITVIL